MNESVKYIECEIHGKQQETFVCQHVVYSLHDNTPSGFWWANDPGNPRPNAWCTTCNENIAKTNGEWTEEVLEHAQVRLLCGACYDNAKELNLGSKKKWWQFWR